VWRIPHSTTTQSTIPWSQDFRTYAIQKKNKINQMPYLIY